MGMGATRMGQPNSTQLQNQYLPPGQFPGSSPGRGSGPVGMNQQGAQTAVPPVRTQWQSDSTLQRKAEFDCQGELWKYVV